MALTQVAGGMIASGQTITSPTITGGTWTSPSGSTITSGTAVASTSGTSIDFTSIPSWVKRITVMFNGVSTSGTSAFTIQLGTGGSPTTSGYTSICGSFQGTTASNQGGTNGFFLTTSANMGAASTVQGLVVCSLLGSNVWTCAGNLSRETGSGTAFMVSGSVTLSGALNLVRITTTGGTDTFDAGSINILYE